MKIAHERSCVRTLPRSEDTARMPCCVCRQASQRNQMLPTTATIAHVSRCVSRYASQRNQM